MQLHCVTGIKPDDASVSPGSVGKNGESGLELTGFDGAFQNSRRSVPFMRGVAVNWVHGSELGAKMLHCSAS